MTALRFEADYSGLIHFTTAECLVEVEVVEDKVIEVPDNSTTNSTDTSSKDGKADDNKGSKEAGEDKDEARKAEAKDENDKEEGDKEKDDAKGRGMLSVCAVEIPLKVPAKTLSGQLQAVCTEHIWYYLLQWEALTATNVIYHADPGVK